jgi:hypothetical protein
MPVSSKRTCDGDTAVPPGIAGDADSIIAAGGWLRKSGATGGAAAIPTLGVAGAIIFGEGAIDIAGGADSSGSALLEAKGVSGEANAEAAGKDDGAMAIDAGVTDG